MSLYRQTLRSVSKLALAYEGRVTVESLDPARLKKEGCEAVIFDHDGVLGPNKGIGPDEGGNAVLARFVMAFGAGKIFILSNTRSVGAERKAHYEKNLPDVVWLTAERKPSADGLQQAAMRVGVSHNKVAVIDDGLLTGILMAVENNARPIYAVREKLNEGLWPKIIRLTTTGSQLFLFHLARSINRET